MTLVRIGDGTGTGQEARVHDQRLQTDTISRGVSTYESIQGNSYNINSGLISLTTATKSAVLYLKNNGDPSIILEVLVVMIGVSTGGSGNVSLNVLRNPTTGTIITNQVIADIPGGNRNNGSSQLLDATIYKGAQGATFTSGTNQFASLLNQTPQRTVITLGDLVLPKGTSFGLEFTPATGNTSLQVMFALGCYVDGDV